MSITAAEKEKLWTKMLRLDEDIQNRLAKLTPEKQLLCYSVQQEYDAFGNRFDKLCVKYESEVIERKIEQIRWRLKSI